MYLCNLCGTALYHHSKDYIKGHMPVVPVNHPYKDTLDSLYRRQYAFQLTMPKR